MTKLKLGVSAAALVLAGAVTTGDVHSQSIEVASTFPKGLTYLGEGGEYFVERLREISEGEIDFEIFGAGELVPAFEVFDAVSSGAVRAGWDWIGYWGDRIPVAGLVGAMPFGPDSRMFLSWMWDGDGMDIIQRAYDPYNVKVLPCHLTAAEAGGWFNVEITGPESYEGLRFRISGLGGRVMDKIGASTSLIPAGELYVSLERGRIDGLEFSLPNIDQDLGIHQIASYYYFPGWHQPASWNSFIINMDVWNEYSEHEQNLFWTACRDTVLWSMMTAAKPQVSTIQEFEEAGVTVDRLPDSLLDALREATQEVMEESAAEDELFREAYESLTEHMETERVWYELQRLD
jgi:TRAP-type mannitol/chloroaromatic compound transport system substrate-binding protein